MPKFCVCNDNTHEGDCGVGQYAYFASSRYYDRHAFLVGPFRTHALALAAVKDAKRTVYKHDLQACWYGYGTCRLPLDQVRDEKVVGKLHELMDVQVDADGFVIPKQEWRAESFQMLHEHITRKGQEPYGHAARNVRRAKGRRWDAEYQRNLETDAEELRRLLTQRILPPMYHWRTDIFRRRFDHLLERDPW